ncbi:dTDP-4-dehydrorhamnose reductase [Terasakiella sp. A23]|uniref:dTDP-4-dehydrorhamnose reductase n=1 Tax=Terasakiella sp. FCG-A23 TaxID=3080561 RepID=UPI002954E66E|nr:dTDP-4-dehydrorhamnose reductase [Terasakiella sp. A23]MDV7341630.1 dTDP-4-dehydrorhamnose reductase [Terasakiella sp. A23]
MNIIVLGRNGQVAQMLQQEAQRSPDIQLYSFGRNEVDILSADDLQAKIAPLSPDLIVNAAAYTAVDKAEEDKANAFALNRDAVEVLGKLASSLDKPLIHISTDYVFDGCQETPYKEEDPMAPTGVYGSSKRAGEEALRNVCDKHIILRTAWVYSHTGNNFVKTMLRIMAAYPEIRVVNDQFGTPTSAQEIAKAILKMAGDICSASFNQFGTYHMVAEGRCSWFDFALEINDQASRLYGNGWSGADCVVHPIPTEEYPTLAKRPAFSALNTEKFTTTFGFSLPKWQESLHECLNQLPEGKVS